MLFFVTAPSCAKPLVADLSLADLFTVSMRRDLRWSLAEATQQQPSWELALLCTQVLLTWPCGRSRCPKHMYLGKKSYVNFPDSRVFKVSLWFMLKVTGKGNIPGQVGWYWSSILSKRNINRRSGNAKGNKMCFTFSASLFGQIIVF